MITWAFLAASKAAGGHVHRSVIRTPEREITTVLVQVLLTTGEGSSLNEKDSVWYDSSGRHGQTAS